MEPKPIVELHTFLHPTDELLPHVGIFLATTIICSPSSLNYSEINEPLVSLMRAPVKAANFEDEGITCA